ncbi:MAG: hypothetical protein U0W24_22410 [Bacteroidales bacterium]
MVQINNENLVLVLGLIVGLVIIKLLGRFLYRVVGVLILLVAVLVYTYFFTDYFVEHPESKVGQMMDEKMGFVSVVRYQKEHCLGSKPMTRKDSITCECIVAPLVRDLKERLTEAEINELEKDKKLYFNEVMTSLKRNEKEIQFNLKERNAIYLWNKMVLNLKEGKVIGEE